MIAGAVCQYCPKPATFYPQGGGRKNVTCGSVGCSKKRVAEWGKAHPRPTKKKLCTVCGDPMVPQKGGVKTHPGECRTARRSQKQKFYKSRRARRIKRKYNCEICLREIRRQWGGKPRYCPGVCRREARAIWNQENREKLIEQARLARIKRTPPRFCVVCGEVRLSGRKTCGPKCSVALSEGTRQRIRAKPEHKAKARDYSTRCRTPSVAKALKLLAEFQRLTENLKENGLDENGNRNP